MTGIEENYFALLRIGLRTSKVRETTSGLSAREWQDIYDLSVAQGTAAFVWDALQELQAVGQLPHALRLSWAYHVGQVEYRYAKQTGALSGLAALLAVHAVPLMVLKGYGLSRCYPRPEHRPCGDIDIWLFGKQREADDLLRRERNIAIDEGKHHHTIFFFEGVMVENHYDFLNIHSHASNKEIERLLRRYAGVPGEKVRVGQAGILLPSAQFNALFLLRHAAAHFAAAQIGMRHVADWAMFVGRYHDRIDWQELCATARQMNMHRFLGCLNAIAIDRLGLDAALFPAFERDTRLENRVLNDILHPEFREKRPHDGLLRVFGFKIRRWYANRWKHRIVYRERLVPTFFRQVYCHLLKPRTLVH